MTDLECMGKLADGRGLPIRDRALWASAVNTALAEYQAGTLTLSSYYWGSKADELSRESGVRWDKRTMLHLPWPVFYRTRELYTELLLAKWHGEPHVQRNSG